MLSLTLADPYSVKCVFPAVSLYEIATLCDGLISIILTNNSDYVIDLTLKFFFPTFLSLFYHYFLTPFYNLQANDFHFHNVLILTRRSVQHILISQSDLIIQDCLS